MGPNSGPMADNVKGNLFSSIDKYGKDVKMYSSKGELDEQDLIKFQMASARFNMIVQLTSNLVKEMTDTEKAIAQKM